MPGPPPESHPSAANERTPIVHEAARSPSYRAIEPSPPEPGASAGPKSLSQDASPVPRQRKTGGVRNGTTIVNHNGPPSNEVDRSMADDHDHDSQAWYSRTLAKYGAVELDNKGSVARDHLALERTFLAWLRTSLSFASIGIAITQLFRLNTTIQDGNGVQPTPNAPASRLRQVGKPLGATFLALAVLVLLAGWRRYFEAQFHIIRGKFPASRGSVMLTTVASFALVVTTFVVVLVVDPSRFEAT